MIISTARLSDITLAGWIQNVELKFHRTEIPVCKFLRGWRAYRPKPFFFFFFFKSCPLYVFIHFSAAFCTAHCALDLARDHAP